MHRASARWVCRPAVGSLGMNSIASSARLPSSVRGVRCQLHFGSGIVEFASIPCEHPVREVIDGQEGLPRARETAADRFHQSLCTVDIGSHRVVRVERHHRRQQVVVLQVAGAQRQAPLEICCGIGAEHTFGRLREEGATQSQPDLEPIVVGAFRRALGLGDGVGQVCQRFAEGAALTCVGRRLRIPGRCLGVPLRAFVVPSDQWPVRVAVSGGGNQRVCGAAVQPMAQAGRRQFGGELAQQFVTEPPAAWVEVFEHPALRRGRR